MRKLYYSFILLAVIIAVGLLIKAFIGNPPNEYQYNPTGYNSFIPETDDLPYATYIQVNKSRIKSALTPLFNHQKPDKHTPSLKQIIENIAPFEIPPIPENLTKKSKGHRIGFIFFHGLGNTAYDFKIMAAELHKHYPQSLMRAPMYSGHGTVIADSLDVTFEEWKKIANYTISSMNDLVDDLFLVGYSTGGALILDYINAHPQKDSSHPKIKGLVLFNPAIAAKNDLIRFTPYLTLIKPYYDIAADLSPYIYESWTSNLLSEFYQLINNFANLKPNTIPTLIALSSDDITTDSNETFRYFCNQNHNPLSTLLLFKSKDKLNKQLCKPTHVFDLRSDPKIKKHYRYMSFSHRSLIHSARHPVFGFDKSYPNCIHYELLEEKSKWNICLHDNEKTVYGEEDLLNEPDQLGGKILRRASFNPYYDQMMTLIREFIASAIKKQSPS
ncbi:MAG TPA: hypothetical protein QF353_02755 [Gammaproteobacteria bacterium]|nr:hypothetical protein [Gammaproteobacteria bacterium]